MKTQLLDFTSAGLVPLNTVDLQSIEGGKFLPDWGLGHLIDFAIEYSAKALIGLANASADHEARVRHANPHSIRPIPGL